MTLARVLAWLRRQRDHRLAVNEKNNDARPDENEADKRQSDWPLAHYTDLDVQRLERRGRFTAVAMLALVVIALVMWWWGAR